MLVHLYDRATDHFDRRTPALPSPSVLSFIVPLFIVVHPGDARSDSPAAGCPEMVAFSNTDCRKVDKKSPLALAFAGIRIDRRAPRFVA